MYLVEVKLYTVRTKNAQSVLALPLSFKRLRLVHNTLVLK